MENDEIKPDNAENRGDRDNRGRFVKGNTAGAGTSGPRRVSELRNIFLARAKPEDIEELFDNILKAAKGGDIQAAKVLLPYLLGKPENLDDNHATCPTCQRLAVNDQLVRDRLRHKIAPWRDEPTLDKQQ